MTRLAEPLNIIPLGGVGELGKNMFAVQHGQHILLVDGGFTYAPSDMLGVEFLVPAPEWIIENRKKIVGWVLTHAHEDHIGGMAYLVGHLPHVPIFGAKFTLEFLKASLSDVKLDPKAFNLCEVATDGRIELGKSFTVDFFRMTHSVPDNVGLVIRTPVGCVVYTGDFKLEHHPLDGQTSQLHKLALAGQEGVLALLSDSTNAERPGFTPSEKTVRDGVDRIIAGAEGRVLVTTSSTNIHRLQSLVHIAERYGRRVVVEGDAVVRAIGVALETGYLETRHPLLPLSEAATLPDQEICVICTGSQGQPEEALSQLIAGTHAHLSAKPGDTVIVSATPLPGNVEAVDRLLDQLSARGVEVYYPPYHPVHASGHASREELKLILDLTRPKFFLPWHGEMRHLVNHAVLAQGMAQPPELCLIPQNGDILQFGPDSLLKTGSIKTDVIYIDKRGVNGELSEGVVRDRQALAQQGILAVMVVLTAEPTIEFVALGGMSLSRDLESALAALVRKSVGRNGREKRDLKTLRDDIFYPLRRHLRKATGREPLIIPTLIEV